MAKSHIKMTVNGKPVEELVEPRTLLIHFLREQLMLTGPHIGCETSHCGACTVDLDGKSVKSCTMFAVQADGADIRTIEGMANAGRHAACAAGRFSRDARPAMRLLHARNDHARLPAPPGEQKSVRGGNPLRHFGQSVPLHRLSEHRQSHSISPPRNSPACRSRRPQNERHDPHLRRTRRKTGRHGLQAKARRGRPLHPGQGKLRRRSETARHALRRPGALAPRPRQGQEDRHHQGRGGARRRRGTDCRGFEDRQPRLDADARRRRADGARRRQGAVPEPGSRLRGRRKPRGRGRRRRAGRSRVRGAAGQRRSAQGHGAECADDPRGFKGQDRRRPRQAQALQPHLLLGCRRQGRDRRGFCQGRRHDQGIHRLSAGASVPARDLPMRRLVRQGQGRADAVGHVPGAARHSHRGLADLENSRAQDSRHFPRHRRRFRQQGRRLSGLYLLDRRLDRHRTSGEMGRGPDRESLDHGVRPRLPHGHGDRRDQGRQGDGDALLHHRRPRRVRRLRQCHEVAGGAVQHHQRLVRFPGGVLSGRRRLYQQGAGRRRLSLLVPRHRGGLLHRAGHGHHGAKARHGSGGVSLEEPDPARAVPVHQRRSAGSTIPATITPP